MRVRFNVLLMGLFFMNYSWHVHWVSPDYCAHLPGGAVMCECEACSRGSFFGHIQSLKFWAFMTWKYWLLFAAFIPRWKWGGSTGGDHQGSRYTYTGGNQVYESQLHRVQVPANQGSSLAQSVPQTDATRSSGLGLKASSVLSKPALQCGLFSVLAFSHTFTFPVDGKWISLVWKGALLSYQADHVELDWYCNSRIVASLYCSPLVLTGANFLLILFGCMQLEACVHPFFDELRDPNCRLPNGRPLPPLFNFKPQELKGATPDILQRLIPEHARKQNPTLALWGHPASLHFASLLAFSTFQWWILL
jgi:hypothetical protein